MGDSVTLPFPTGQDKLADTPVYIENLRTAFKAAIGAVNYVPFGPVVVTTDANGRFTYTVPGMRVLAGIVFQHKGGSTVHIVARAFGGADVVADIWVAQTGANAWGHTQWAGNFEVFGFAWGEKT
jgi:hypothetical protein